MSSIRKQIKRWFIAITAAIGIMGAVYVSWSPGLDVRDGRHDRATNGLWLQHGWLGDDAWFTRNQRDVSRFRSDERIAALAAQLRGHHITDVFPHLRPCESTGQIARVDAQQVERFLDGMREGVRVIPWVGGVFEGGAWPDSPAWRKRFIESIVALLAEHPRLAGVQVNIEPMPSGHAGFLVLLEELRAVMPKGKVLSVAAYPPPTRWHPVLEVHWERAYFQAVSSRVDQMAVMMYDTAIRWEKPYRQLMKEWTREVIEWAGDTPVLLGLPAYDDAGTDYHHPHVENLSNGLLGIHAGLASFESLPRNYQGAAIYSEWEMSDDEWRMWRERFIKPASNSR